MPLLDTVVPIEPFRGRVALVVSNLEYGGAQRQVVALANDLQARGGDAIVVSLSSYVPLAADLHHAEARLRVVRKRHRLDVTVATRLARLLRRSEVDVTHAFLVDAEIAARLAGALYPRTTVIGSERNSDYVPQLRHSLPLRLTERWCAAIIANSNAGRRFRIETLGARPESVYVVHNGVELDRFKALPSARARELAGLPREGPVVGMFASFKTQKNHPMFFRMARRVLDRHPDAVFVCVGAALHRGLQGSDGYHASMGRMIDELGLAGSVRLAGNQEDLVPWYSACDVTVLTSQREGTPNVLLESMACETPVVATDVADNAIIVPEGETGFIVDYDDDATMAERVSGLLEHPGRRREMGSRARALVEREYSVARLAEKTSAVYRTVLAKRGQGR